MLRKDIKKMLRKDNVSCDYSDDEYEPEEHWDEDDICDAFVSSGNDIQQLFDHIECLENKIECLEKNIECLEKKVEYRRSENNHLRKVQKERTIHNYIQDFFSLLSFILVLMYKIKI
jgi:predicted RNase H-like nuclease (RuvC/YqgF family)